MGTSSYKENIDAINNDWTAMVQEAYDSAKNQLANVKTENLKGGDRALPTDLKEKLENANVEFAQEKTNTYNSLKPQFDACKQRHNIFLAVWIGLVVLGVLTSLVGIGVFLIIAGIICYFVFKSMDEKQSYELANSWKSFFLSWAERFGSAEDLHNAATGIYAEVDELYLKSLDDQARGFEMQQRQTQKQMQAQQEQSEAQMAVMKQQLALQQAQHEQMLKKMKRR